MNKFYFSLLCFFLACTLSFAQSNFKPGYVTTSAGDTIKGQVDYQEWGSNPASIRFKVADGKIRNLTPADIKFFSIDKMDQYMRYSGPISRDETNSNRILGGRDTSFIVKEVFLKVLQTGKVINLYAYLDDLKARYFYSDPNTDNVVHELVYRIYYNGNTGGNIQKSSTTVEAGYFQQLIAVALKANVFDDDLQKAMEGAEYTKSDLLKIVTKMNGYTKAQLALTQPLGNEDSFDLYAGLGLNVTKNTSFDDNGKTIGKSYTSILPRALFGINVYVNPNTRRLLFSAELSVTDIKYKNSFGNTNYSFNQLAITLTPAISYNIYNGKDFKFYAGLGLGISKYIFSNKKFVRNDGSQIPMIYFPFLFSGYDNAISYKVGFLVHKKIQVYIEHLSANPISHDSAYGFKQTSNNIGINYILGKQK